MRWSEGYRKLPYLLVLLAGAGLSISLYLAVTHYGKKPIACGGIGQCDYVNSSEYASVGGIPVSLLGVGLYAALIASALFWSWRPSAEGRMVLYWGLSLSGAGYAAYLTYVELAVLRAICVWCVVSAVILAVSLLAATAALFWVPSAAAEEGAFGSRDRRQAYPPRASSHKS